MTTRTACALVLAASVLWALAGCDDSPADADADADADGDGDADVDGDGDGDGDADADGDGDIDSDGDGLPDSVEDADGDGEVDPGESDPHDADTDNDGIDDGDEGTGDSDGDGVPDVLESDTFDGDGDGTADAADSDNTDGPCASPPRLLDDVTLSADATFSLACSPYVVAGNLVIAGGATLTIEAGVEVRARRRGWITLGDGASTGQLAAVGTAAAPIALRSDEPAPAAGDWGGLYVEDTTAARLEFATISHAGMTGRGGEEQRGSVVVLGGTGLTLREVDVADGLGYGVYAVPFSSPAGDLFTDFSANSIARCERGLAVELDRLGEVGADNVISGTIDVHGSEVTRDATWTDLGAPLRIVENAVEVLSGVTLTVAEGVEVVVPAETLLTISGTLLVAGTAANRVSVSSESGSAGTWQGIDFYYSPGSDLRFFTVTGAGAPNSYLSPAGAALTVRELPLTTEGVQIVRSAGYGIYFEDAACGGQTFAATYEDVADCSVYCWPDDGEPTCLLD